MRSSRARYAAREPTGKVTASDQAIEDAARIVRRLATTKAAPQGLGTNKEDEARLGFEAGRSVYQVNYTFIYPSAAMIKASRRRSAGALSAHRGGQAQPAGRSAGSTSAWANYTKHADLASRLHSGLSQPEEPGDRVREGGLPPTSKAVYNDRR